MYPASPTKRQYRFFKAQEQHAVIVSAQEPVRMSRWYRVGLGPHISTQHGDLNMLCQIHRTKQNPNTNYFMVSEVE